MEILKTNSVDLKNVCVILGFFDGIHLGHKAVISSAVAFAKKQNLKTVLLTFASSPAKYFKVKNLDYIYTRDFSYELISRLGVDYIIEKDFSLLANISAESYVESIIKDYAPQAIFTGFNHTFGVNRVGTPDFLELVSKKTGFQYFPVAATLVDNEIVSSTIIKQYLRNGNICKANQLLGDPFVIKSNVVKGVQLGRKMGFPTANMNYPEDIVKLAYGVYKVEVLGQLAVLNWGVKPTVNNNSKECLEVHIPNFDNDLYGQILTLKILEKLRDEKKFSNIDDLKLQIKKDIEACLKS